jgi:hypothetical protein
MYIHKTTMFFKFQVEDFDGNKAKTPTAIYQTAHNPTLINPTWSCLN